MNVQELERVFKKLELRFEDILNGFDLDTMQMMSKACVTLEAKTKLDELVVTSVEVRAMILDDIRMIQHNLKCINNAIKLKELRFDVISLN